jgi:hypothetical protein
MREETGTPGPTTAPPIERSADLTRLLRPLSTRHEPASQTGALPEAA